MQKYIKIIQNKKAYYFTTEKYDLLHKFLFDNNLYVSDDNDVVYLGYCSVCLDYQQNILLKCCPQLGRILDNSLL